MLVGYTRVSSDGDRQSTNRSATFSSPPASTPGISTRTAPRVRGPTGPAWRERSTTSRRGDTPVVWRLDRMGRSLSYLLDVISRIEQRGVGFRSITEGMDTSTAAGRLLFSICGTLAEFERSLIQERVRAGLEAAKRRGRRGGRPPVADDEKLEAIQAPLAGGATKAAVCRTFNIERSTLNDTLARTPRAR